MSLSWLQIWLDHIEIGEHHKSMIAYMKELVWVIFAFLLKLSDLKNSFLSSSMWNIIIYLQHDSARSISLSNIWKKSHPKSSNNRSKLKSAMQIRTKA